MRSAEAVALLIGTGALLVVHARMLRHAGPLWRDEVNSLELARMPSLGDIAASLRYDSFPILGSVILRIWSAAPWGGRLEGIRVLGLLVGVSALAILWLDARIVGRTLPWISIPLFGWNLVMLRGLDAIRPYGLGTVCILVLFGAVWRLASARLTAASLALAALAAVASVQLLYTNAFFVLAIGLAGTAVAWRRGELRSAAAILAIGGLAAVSLIPYRSSIAGAGEWAELNRGPASIASIGSALAAALGTPAALFVAIWAAILAWAAVRWARAWTKAPDGPIRGRTTPGSPAPEAPPPDASLYAGWTLLIGAPLFLGALWTSRFPTQPWYYVPLVGLASSVCDVLLAARRRTPGVDGLRALAAGGAIAASLVPIWNGARERRTNIDLVAAKLVTEARPGDLVLVNPWFLGVGFRHVYRGPVEWTTVPPLADLRIHRYDLVKRAVESGRAADPVVAAARRTLEAGRPIWLVGGLPNPPPGRAVPDLAAPPPDRPWPRPAADYLAVEGMQVASAIRPLASAVEPVSILSSDPISPYESVTLFRITPAAPKGSVK